MNDKFSQSLLSQAVQFKINGQFSQAIELLQKIVLDDPFLVSAYEELGDNYLSLKEYDKALKSLEQALKIQPQSANALYLLGFLYSVKQDWNHSVALLEQANSLLSNNPEILRCLGWSLYHQTSRSQGLALLERSWVLKPKDANILCDLGICYMNSCDFARAEKVFSEVVQLYPASDQAKECSYFLSLLQKSRIA